ncbi:Glycoside hydrolase family 38 protein [Mycena kentingensis (nom. inval.)]|nr:Glycoside hydrolase family 38 protein [Mycena kentingensis (nom. inval.)]
MTARSASAPYPELNSGSGNKWIKNLTRDRIGQFNGGHFNDVNLGSVLYERKDDGPDYVELQVWSAPGLSRPLFNEAVKQEFKPAKKGDSFGPSCITGGYAGDRRVEYIIPAAARKAGIHKFIIESSCNGMFGQQGGGISPPDPNRYFRLDTADIVVPNQDAWRLLWDFQTLRELVDTLPGNTSLQNLALKTANEIMNVFDHRDKSSINRARKVAEKVFGTGWDSPEVFSSKALATPLSSTQVPATGYCHIDTAWLWPYHVTQQKTARSWSTQIDLMERYPEHRFSCSQAQQFKWLEQQYPSLFKRLSAKVAEGKFQLVGGAWVEHDGNMPSGEAFVRQMVYGQRYFESRFGVRCETAWLPDSFGLSAALPQLFRGAGMKVGSNVFPHSTFNWVGIDGTQVLCHMTPVDTYTAQATVGDVNRAITNHKNLESSDSSLLVFGNGDGGGGPLPKMATSNKHGQLAPVVQGHSVDEFFDYLAESTDAGKGLPNWRGELYLEFHRGTYTSHGSIKKGNRHSEILLRDVEHVATLASLAGRKKYVYPKETIEDSWEKVLLNQFHDVLPGSAIAMAYDDAEQLYSEVRKDGKKMLDDALDVILGGVQLQSARHAQTLDQLVAYNTTFFPRREVISVPVTGALRSHVAQLSTDGKEGYAVVDCKGGARPAPVETTPITEAWGFVPVSVYTNGSDHFVLRNASVQLTISRGRITSLVDVALGRELIQEGQTGGLVIFEDRPNYWDAWDVEIHHLEKPTPLEFTNVSVVAHGPLRAAVRAEVKYGQSNISVTISLDAVPATTNLESRGMFRFDAWVDWRQRHEFLKFELPLDIHSDNATYETQFGWVQRPTHKNTTWDMAKFEVCGHKYADLSEFGYGVAILSESKYGFSCQGNVLRISLLRAATEPDAEQDQGEHTFSWAVLPHKGHFLESDVPMAGYLFNSPLYVRSLGTDASARALSASMNQSPFNLVGASNVILETVKRGDMDSKSGETSVVLRIYEAFGGRASAQLRIATGLGVEAAYETNLLEEVADKAKPLRLAVCGERELGLDLSFRGFEVKTVKLVVAKKGKSYAALELPSCAMGPSEGAQDVLNDAQREDGVAPQRGRPAWKSVSLVLICTLAMITNLASSSSVSVFLPVIGQDLDIPQNQLQWLVSAFSLSSGCFLLLFGRLSDLFGRKKFYTGGTVYLGVLSLGCGFANDANALFVLRGLQGLGPAAFIPACLGILAHAFPPSRARSAAFATFSTGAPIGGAVGTQIGGLLTQYTAATWHSPFYLIAGISTEKDRRVDWLGGFLVTAGLVLLVFVLSQGPVASNGWKTPYIIALLILGVLLLAAFLFWQRYLEKNRETQRPPLMKLSMWSRAKGKFAVMQSIAFFQWAAFLSWYFWAQVYYEDFQGLSAVLTAVRMLPMTVTGALCNLFVMLVIARLDFVILISIGTFFTGLGALLFALIKPSSPYWAFGFPATIASVFGADFVFAGGTIFVAKVCLPHEQSLAGGIFQTLTQLGTAFGLAISTIAFDSVASENNSASAPLAAYKAAQWSSFGMAMFCTLLAILFLRGVGPVGSNAKSSSSDTEHSTTVTADTDPEKAAPATT